MKKHLSMLLAVCCLIAAFSLPASALEYTFEAPSAGLFGTPTSDNTIYVTTAAPVNTDRSKNAAYIPPAFGSATSYTLNAGELLTPNLVGQNSGTIIGSTGGGVTVVPPSYGTSTPSQDIGAGNKYTSVTSDLYYSGGHIGTLKISAIGLTVKVYQGTDSATLAKGAGHFENTSFFNGNTAIAAHNRGVANHFGKIHTLDLGDSIKLTTKLGTRTYEVYSVAKISSSDLSVLNDSSENTLKAVCRTHTAFSYLQTKHQGGNLMKKRIISLFLVMVTILGMLPTVSLAASTEEEALGEVDIYNGGTTMAYLSINGRIREQIYTYYNYVNSNGQTKEIPAYCVNPNTKGVPQTVAPGESIQYLAKEKASDPKVMGIIANGYPTRGLGELKVENKYHAYYATKMALWCYLLPNWDIANLKVNPNLTGLELQRAQAILAAAKDIYRRSTAWSQTLAPKLTTSVDREEAYDVTIDGKQYKQQVFTVNSETWVCDYDIAVSFSKPDEVPAGTRIVDMENKDITAVTTTDTGNGYSGKFKVLYPADAVAGQSGSVQLFFSASVYKYAIYYAVCAEQSKYGTLQNYMCDTDPTTPTALMFAP